MIWADAIEQAKRLRTLLAPACERVEIAGSLRRLCPEVHDLEFVAIPRQDPFNELQLKLTGLLAEGVLRVGPRSSDGKRAPLGPKYYRLTLPVDILGQLEIQVDIFSVTAPADWGVIYTLRTGSRHFSHWLAIEARRHNREFDHGQLFVWDKSKLPWQRKRLPCPEEQHVFTNIGVPWIPPQKRELAPAPNVGVGPYAYQTVEAVQ